MDRSSSRIAQVYGYAVCLVSVIVFLISLSGIVGAVFNFTDPIHAEQHGSSFGPSYPLSSFEEYKLAAQRASSFPAGPSADTTRARHLSDEQLRQNYQAERDDKIGYVKFHALRTLVLGIVFSLLAVVLFSLHWRWLRKMNIEAMTS